MTNGKGPARQNRPHHTQQHTDRSGPHRQLESQQAAWWPVHQYITALISQAEHLPLAGTPAWCELADGDPRKLLALAAAGEHHVLRVETAQQAHADASREIAAAATWSTLAHRVTRGRGPAYIPRTHKEAS